MYKKMLFSSFVLLLLSTGCIKKTNYVGEIANMVYIPQGSFIMGSLEEDGRVGINIGKDELPQHKVYVDGFYVDTYETSIGEYKRFLEETGNRPPLIWTMPEYNVDLEEDFYPVRDVSYSDAFNYCKWRGARLLTEIEWEKAARGTDGRRYPWGNEWINDACTVAKSHEFQWSTPVNSNPSGKSLYGVYNMCGNVGEHTDSDYDPYPGSKVDWGIYRMSKFKVFRGTPYMKETMRNARREKEIAHIDNVYVGIRCAK